MFESIPAFKGLGTIEVDSLSRVSKHLELARGEHAYQGAPVDGEDTALFVVLFGDVSIHRTQHTGREEVVNYLTVGDVFVERLIVDEDTRHLRITAMCPVRLLKIPYGQINEYLRKDERFFTSFSDTLRSVVDRQKTRFDDRFQKDIARFLVQERLTFSGRVKLKRMDLCIECDGCYQACMSRHGTDRLGPSEVKYGTTEVPQNCHNCVVPECMDKCKFGHIGRHEETGEIVIDDNCIGCTMCSKGCSFGSIRMHPIADLDLGKYFPNRAPDAKGKAIAQKCDNCTGYSSQACIDACPTGALFQINGVDLFDHWQQFDVHNQLDSEVVESPIDIPHGWRRFWVIFTILNTMGLAWECFGRLFWPEHSFTGMLYSKGWIEAGVDPELPFKSGDRLSHSLGYVAGSLMLGTQIYRLRRWIGATPVLMEAHIWMGVLGAIYAFFHTAFVFNDPIAISTFITMMLAVITGIVGRYVVYLVPRTKAGTAYQLDEMTRKLKSVDEEIQAGFSNSRTGHTAIVRLSELVEKEAVPEEVGGGWRRLLAQLFGLHKQDRVARRAVENIAVELAADLDQSRRAEVERLMLEKSRLERSLRQQEFFGRVLKKYRIIHVSASNVMFAALALHIVFALMYQVS